MRELLIVETERSDVRAEIVGWTHEDPRLVREGAIGLSRSPVPLAMPDCVLRALSEGWELLAPPKCSFVQIDDGKRTISTFEWWLTRGVQR